MPADIRNFFGGRPGATAPKQENVLGTEDNFLQISQDEESSRKSGHAQSKSSSGVVKKRRKARMVLEDSDDDGPLQANKITPKRSVTKSAVKKQPLKEEETTTTDYFASSGKGKMKKQTRSYSKTKSQASSPVATPRKVPAHLKKDKTDIAELNGRRPSQRKGTKKTYGEYNDDDKDAYLGSDADAGDDIFAADTKNGGRREDDRYIESESEEDLIPNAGNSYARRGVGLRKSGDIDMKDSTRSFTLSHEEDRMTMARSNDGQTTLHPGTKRKSLDAEDDMGEEEYLGTPGKRRQLKNATQKHIVKRPRARKEDTPENPEIQAIFDSIPTVRAPTPPPRDDENRFDWRAAGAGNLGPPPSAGAKEIPQGAEDCLAGLTFVFTGQLDTISREVAQELVKRHGGRVTGTPSSKTSYVVLGSDAGPNKLEKIRALNIKTVNEDGLFELIRRLPVGGGGGKAAEKSLEKKKAAEEKIKLEAAEMEREEKRVAAEARKAILNSAVARGIPPIHDVASKHSLSSQLWTTKYAPTKTNQICGNKGQIEKIQKWLERWSFNRKRKFLLPGPDGSGKFRAIIIHGPPGIGKTTAAHLAAKLEGYDVIESNASDTRSKKLVESGLNEVLNNNSLLGFFAGDGKEVDRQMKKIVLIMDEVDGMSAGDRGGVGALAKVCKKTEVPMILICNERRIPKMKPFDHVAYDIAFKRPTVEQVRSRIATICMREGLKIPAQVMDALIEGSNKDIRQIINMLSTAKLDQTSMDFDQGKSMSKAWEKHIVLKPWDICHKLLGGGMFAPTSKATLNDKIELYFNDHELSYLMIQENYLNTRPLLATNQGLSLKEQKLKTLALVDKAAESISDGDLVDRMIHGSHQQWSLMPTHAVYSTVIPASFMSGVLSGNTAFPAWLGNNSKQSKMVRYIREIQAHMRLRTSGDRHEVRQQYLPVLWERLIRRLEVDGRDSVDEVIKLMDSYFLTKDDFDYIMELGLGPQSQNGVKIETSTKAAFTRLYNAQSHPLPFMKASNVTAAQKGPKLAPDLEEAIEEDDDGEILVDDHNGDEDNENADLMKDKYIKKQKAPKADAARKPPNKRGKNATKGKDPEESENDSEAESRSKMNQRGKTKGGAVRGKAGK